MIDMGMAIYIFVSMSFAIIFMWIVTEKIIENKMVLAFLPFFLISIVEILRSSFIFNGLYKYSSWSILEVFVGVYFLGIVVAVRRLCKWR